jgi:hypothetical protein
VTAAGLDHGVAIASGVEARSKSNMQRRLNGEGSGRPLCQPSIDNNKKLDGRKDVCIWINQDRNFIRLQRRPQLVPFHETGGHVFNALLSLVNRLSKGDRAADCQRLGEFGHDDLDPGAMQAKRNARSKVACPAHQDEGRSIF